MEPSVTAQRAPAVGFTRAALSIAILVVAALALYVLWWGDRRWILPVWVTWLVLIGFDGIWRFAARRHAR